MGNLDQILEYYHAMGVHVDHSNFQYSCADGVVTWEMARKGLGILPMLGRCDQGP